MFMNRVHRTSQSMRDSSVKMLTMSGADEPSKTPVMLASFDKADGVREFATGCDADIGGTSSVHLDYVADPASPNGAGYAKFWGEMRLGVRQGLEGKLRSGYAGFHRKPRPTLFSELTDDISRHEFLALRVRAGGHPRTRNSYFVNINTDEPVPGDLWQHRLFFARDDGGWEDIFIPFKAFAFTSFGELSQGTHSMDGERVRWIGVSLLGGNAGIEGPYELLLDSMRAVKRQDVTGPISTASDGTPWHRHAR